MWNYPGLCRCSPDVLTLEFFAYICLFTLIDLLSTTSWRLSILYLVQTSHNWLYGIPSTVSNLTSSSLKHTLFPLFSWWHIIAKSLELFECIPPIDHQFSVVTKFCCYCPQVWHLLAISTSYNSLAFIIFYREICWMSLASYSILRASKSHEKKISLTYSCNHLFYSYQFPWEYNLRYFEWPNRLVTILFVPILQTHPLSISIFEQYNFITAS